MDTLAWGDEPDEPDEPLDAPGLAAVDTLAWGDEPDEPDEPVDTLAGAAESAAEGAADAFKMASSSMSVAWEASEAMPQ